MARPSVAARLSFSLANGRSWLAPWFAEVDLRAWEDNLAVTETEPLVAYLLSMGALLNLPDERAAALRAFIQNKLAAAGGDQQSGVLRISKEVGLFVAHGVK